MWIHSYRPLGDHCERKHIRRCPRRPSQPDYPQGRRRTRHAPLPAAGIWYTAWTCCMLCQRARQLLAPPRGPLSAIGGIDSPAAGCQTQASDSPALSHRLPPVSISARARGARLRTCALSRRTRVGQCPRAAAAARSRPTPARSLPASARESHLISNRPSSRFDQFQLPMTSFVCSCHWPPNRFVTCARRCLRSHAT